MTTSATQDGHAGVIEYHEHAGEALIAKIERALAGFTGCPEQPYEVAKAFRSLEFEAGELEACGCFEPECYGRHEIARSDAWVLLAMFWNNCETRIHDHCESECGFHVVRGELEETRFREQPDGSVRAIARRRLSEGGFGTSSRGAIHSLATTVESGHRAISVHAYCPVLERADMSEFAPCSDDR